MNHWRLLRFALAEAPWREGQDTLPKVARGKPRCRQDTNAGGNVRAGCSGPSGNGAGEAGVETSQSRFQERGGPIN
jgi:hypothetical protein